MSKPIFVLLAPLGVLLMLTFTSMTPFRMMSQIGGAMQTEWQVSDVTSMSPVGGLGAVMFGLGMMCLALLRRRPGVVERVMLGFAVLLMIIGAASNLFGDWLMMSAFSYLATAERVDPDTFMNSFRYAESLLLVGNILLLLAAGDIASAMMMTNTEARTSRTSVAVGAISFVFLLLAVFWGQSSMLPFSEILARESVEPSSLAASMNGVLRADFLFQGSVIGFAIATLMVAVSRREEPIQVEVKV